MLINQPLVEDWRDRAARATPPVYTAAELRPFFLRQRTPQFIAGSAVQRTAQKALLMARGDLYENDIYNHFLRRPVSAWYAHTFDMSLPLRGES